VGPESISRILARSLERMQLLRRLRQYQALAVWPEVVGARLARQTQPLRVVAGVLVVGVRNPVWGHQLSLMKGKLLDALNHRLGAPTITDLRFRPLSGQRAVQGGESGVAVWDRHRAAAVRLSSRQVRQIEMWLSPITDEELRDRARRLMITSLRVAKFWSKMGWGPCPVCGFLCDDPKQPCGTCRDRPAE